jgi:hypothetical protein
MVGFGDIDRRFQPKTRTLIALECLNCGCADSTVALRRPRWFTDFKDVVLCAACGLLAVPTAPDLIDPRRTALTDG